jgi:hypothetical protein
LTEPLTESAHAHAQERHPARRQSRATEKDRGTQTPWHYTTFWDWLDHWQTLIAGVFALVAAFGTIVVTRRLANRQITASREEADRVIAATREQISVTAEQTATTIRLEPMHDTSEARAFRAMLEAAMARVLAEAAWARKTYPDTFTETSDVSVDAHAVRQCITKGAFAELRAACIRQGGPLTGEFLDLEREIDSFASQVGTYAFSAATMPVRKGMHAGLGEQLTVIEGKATALREKAARDPWGLTLPGRAEHAGIF